MPYSARNNSPPDWQAQLELCGHNATAARDSIHNQYIQELNNQMLLWYESQRALVHDQIVLNITNDNFAPDILTADPRIREWARRVKDDARERALIGIDQKAKQDAEDNYQTALAQYQLLHDNDLERVRDEYQRDLSRHIAEWQDNIKQAETEYQTKLKDVQARPIITDPTARKKRRGSVSAISSPIITKAQPIQTAPPGPSPNISAQPVNSEPTIATPTPTPPTHPFLADQPTAPVTNPDPIAQLMNMMSAQFSKLTDRLDKIEAQNNNEYSSWETSWDASRTKGWRGAAPRVDDELDEDAKKYANVDYDNAEMYDDPPNDATYMAAAGDAPGLEDSDCILLSGPPTPTTTRPIPTTEPRPAPSGLRPPERAQRVDFQSAKLATDSFGIPVGGRCNSDGTISFSANNPSRNPKPRRPTDIVQHPGVYSNDELHRINKEAIISHAMFAFQHKIPRKYTKAQAIAEYQTAAKNALKPGTRQSTLSFANAAATHTHPQPQAIPRQTTPSTWSKSPSPPPRRNSPPTNNTTWVIRPRMGMMGLTTRPFDGDADRLTEWYRQRLQANAGPNKPALTLVRGAWSNGPKSIFSLTFAGHVTFNTVRSYTPLFLEKFDAEHIFHPGGNALKKIALFNIPVKRDSLGNTQTRRDLFDELIRGGTLAGLHLFDGPMWTPKTLTNPDATSGAAHILVYDSTGSAAFKFFKKQTFMYNTRIASQTAISPKPFIQCTRCHRIGHEVTVCTRPTNAKICHHCGSAAHTASQHKFQCKEQHSGPTCDCPPRCFLCQSARKSRAQFTGHNALDSSCPLRRHTFTTLSGPANATQPAND